MLSDVESAVTNTNDWGTQCKNKKPRFWPAMMNIFSALILPIKIKL